MSKKGCGIIFFNAKRRAVLLFRRDNKDSIPFPNMLDLLGGHVEEGEDPAQTAVREMAEELLDLRTGRPYKLQGHNLFLVYTDKRGCEQHIFTCPVDFDTSNVQLLEGQELVWLTELQLASGVPIAFDFGDILKKFFSSLG
ncbi:MAG: NUDIX domain-containing protein [Candidatus Moranbacteria bacterium]|nr:NUDIX domain-containing protein [Candidatus Moranbacteria bacterium]